jgi:hypothetical protein
MDDRRILELALESLERQKAEVEAAIRELIHLRGSKGVIRSSEHPRRQRSKGDTKTRRPKTEAEKKALSQIMKAVWARRKAENEKKPK